MRVIQQEVIIHDSDISNYHRSTMILIIQRDVDDYRTIIVIGGVNQKTIVLN